MDQPVKVKDWFIIKSEEGGEDCSRVQDALLGYMDFANTVHEQNARLI